MENRTINVTVDGISDKYSYLKIQPFSLNNPASIVVKETIKGTQWSTWDPARKVWTSDIRYWNSLKRRLESLLFSDGIDVNIRNEYLIQDALQAKKDEEKMLRPSLEDYAANPEKYGYVDEPAVEETVYPLLSKGVCAFSHICKKCSGKCSDFFSIELAYQELNRQTASTYLPHEEIKADEDIIPGVLYSGSNKFSSASGTFDPTGRLFTVNAGSIMAENHVKGIPEAAIKKRKLLLRKGYVDKNYEFTVDYQFDGPGEAMQVVVGSSTDWKSFWIAEISEKAKCKGSFILSKAPAMAKAMIRNSVVVGIPLLGKRQKGISESLKFKVLQGCYIPVVDRSKISKYHQGLYADLDKHIGDGRRLSCDYVFPSAADAAIVLSGDPKADSSIWEFGNGITMRHVKQNHEKNILNGMQIYHLEVPTAGVMAAGYYKDDDTLTVLKGSIVSSRLGKRCQDTNANLFRDQITKGNVINGVFIKDVTFKSPSAAAAVCCGREMNGRKEWCKLDGTVLKEENRSVKTTRI